MQQNLLRKISVLILSAAMLIVSGGCVQEVPAEKSVEKSVSRSVDNSFTLMIYMCAAALESEYGCATVDINEILYGYSDSNFNIIIQTGGTLEWQNTVIAGDRCQRYQVTEDGLELVDDTIGQQNMAEPDTLSDFVNYCTDNYTASRYGLILWDHGGGVIGGYGYDENFGGSAMSLTQMHQALETAETHFEFIGFDACLMATLETCLMASHHADYMIASEETEPGCGWYYTNWIESFSAEFHICKRIRKTDNRRLC
ncbi:clostripain-related cysteine peptidase [Porcipelethomonas sp.]|uniref:clostripain-related cysteine peptidase n=1 Tax=Porcipelethomonas sp. TaxID=2981675 RepID=UPI003EF7E691